MEVRHAIISSCWHWCCGTLLATFDENFDIRLSLLALITNRVVNRRGKRMKAQFGCDPVQGLRPRRENSLKTRSHLQAGLPVHFCTSLTRSTISMKIRTGNGDDLRLVAYLGKKKRHGRRAKNAHGVFLSPPCRRRRVCREPESNGHHRKACDHSPIQDAGIQNGLRAMRLVHQMAHS
jgi:hypothetical protein